MEDLLNSQYLKIGIDVKRGLLVEEWQLHFGLKIVEDKFRWPLELILKTCKDKSVKCFLMNITERKRLIANDQVWMETFFFPSLVKSGVEKIAIVSAKDVLGIGMAKNTLKHLTDVVEVEVFNSNAKAEAWLGV